MRLPRALDEVGPVAGAAVMGFGIVSVALELRGHHLGSRVLLVLAAALWLALAVLAVARTARDPARVRRGAHVPAALTAVAATAVIGSRLVLGADPGPAAAALVVAILLWLALLPAVLPALPRRAPGGAFLVAVATTSLGSLCAGLAAADKASWLLVPALVLLLVGLVLYVDVLRRFDWRELLEGQGDHWVAGGALAIAAFACANLAKAATALEATSPDGLHALRIATTVLWVAAMAWLPVLVVCEVLRPRLGYDARRWATVFPVGMYAAMSSATGRLEQRAAITDVGGVLTWVALAVWAVVLAGAVHRSIAITTRESERATLAG